MTRTILRATGRGAFADSGANDVAGWRSASAYLPCSNREHSINTVRLFTGARRHSSPKARVGNGRPTLRLSRHGGCHLCGYRFSGCRFPSLRFRRTFVGRFQLSVSGCFLRCRHANCAHEYPFGSQLFPVHCFKILDYRMQCRAFRIDQRDPRVSIVSNHGFCLAEGCDDDLNLL